MSFSLLAFSECYLVSIFAEWLSASDFAVLDTALNKFDRLYIMNVIKSYPIPFSHMLYSLEEKCSHKYHFLSWITQRWSLRNFDLKLSSDCLVDLKSGGFDGFQDAQYLTIVLQSNTAYKDLAKSFIQYFPNLLQLQVDDNGYLHRISQFCHKLQILKVNFYTTGASDYTEILRNCPNLTFLHAPLNKGVNRLQLLQASIVYGRKLQSLHFRNFNITTFKPIQLLCLLGLHQLDSVTLPMFTEINLRTLLSYRGQKLQKFDINESGSSSWSKKNKVEHQLTSKCVLNLQESYNVEYVSFRCCTFALPEFKILIQKFHNLKTLDCCYCCPELDNGLALLQTVAQCETLENLSIDLPTEHEDCQAIDYRWPNMKVLQLLLLDVHKGVFLNFIHKCPSLRVMNFEWSGNQLTGQSIKELKKFQTEELIVRGIETKYQVLGLNECSGNSLNV